MTLDELAGTLPNGFHDSWLKAVSIDYLTRTALFDCVIDFADYDQTEDQGLEDPDRSAKIVMRDFAYVVVEPPTDRFLLSPGQLALNDVFSTNEVKVTCSLPAVPVEYFRSSFYISTWNAFIHIAAKSAELVWPEQ